MQRTVEAPFIFLPLSPSFKTLHAHTHCDTNKETHRSKSLSLSLNYELLNLHHFFLKQNSPMDEWKRNQVPAFGSWDCSNDDLPFTQCFESATRQANGLIRHSYTYSQQQQQEEEDRDLYVAGDLYANDVLTPAMILVPRRINNNKVKSNQQQVKEERNVGWVKGDYDYDYDELKEPPSPMVLTQASAPALPPRQAPKPVDEDLYRISPELLFAKSKRGLAKRRGHGASFQAAA
ncbi:hypothetical protein LguiB_000537 [Lonicera macranthoides]